MIRLLRLRRLVQVAVLLLLAALPWLNRDGFTGMKGSLFAFDFFGLPFADPLDAVQIGLSGIIPGWRLDSRCACCARRRPVPWAHLLFMVLPFRVLVRTRTRHPGQTSPKAAQTRISVPGRDRACRAGACAPARLSAAQPTFPARRPVPWLSDRRRSALLQNNPHRSGASPLLCRAVFLPVMTVLAVELVTGERLWCRWVCPQSVLLAPTARLPVAPRLRRTLSRCTCKGCNPSCRRRLLAQASIPEIPARPRRCRSAPTAVPAYSPVPCVHGGGPAALALGKKD